MHTRTALAAVALLACSARAAESLKGLELGSSYAAFVEAHPSAVCWDEAPLATCNFDSDDAYLDFGEWRATGASAQFLDGRLYLISTRFDSGAYPSIVALARSKYRAAPRLENSNVQNRFGAKFTNQEAAWRSGSASLEVTRYAGALDTSTMVLYDRGATAKAARVKEVQRAASAPRL